MSFRKSKITDQQRRVTYNTDKSTTVHRKTKNNKLTKSGITHVALIFDKSGSMSACYTEALNCINEQISTLKKEALKHDDDIRLSLILFDNTIDVIYEDVPISEVKKLTSEEYVLGGATALNDATYTATEILLEYEENKKNESFLAIIVTDGYENSSVKSNFEIKSRIQELETTDKWTFTYMLSNVKVSDFCNNYGVIINNCSSYTSTPAGTTAASGWIAGGIGGYMMNKSSGKLSTTHFYGDTTNSCQVQVDKNV